MESKIKIKMGALEVEYEGSEAFLKSELLKLVSTLIEQQSKIQPLEQAAPHTQKASAAHHPAKPIPGTAGSFAIKLGVSTGPELVLAAAAKLALVDGKEKFSRSELSKEMRKATNHFKESYVSNLTQSLKRLQEDNKLLEPSTDNFALTAPALADLSKRLA